MFFRYFYNVLGTCIANVYLYSNIPFYTGNSELDQVILVLLNTSMFVGGFVGFILDNTVPGKVIQPPISV